MKPIAFFVTLTIFLFFFSCGDPVPSSKNGNTPEGTITDSSLQTVDSSQQGTDTYGQNGSSIKPEPAEDLMDCEIKGKTYDKNILRLDDLAQMISIQADKSTYDKDLGESHRILEVLNTRDCSVLLKETLPVNRSADFPYYLTKDSYEPNNKIIAIQGFENFYFYDAENQKLSKPMTPEFMDEVEAADAQSGMIRGLTVWGHYLLGQAVDFGPFAFDIQNKAQPKPVLPVAKYNIRNTSEFRYLFLLDEGNNRSQAIIPSSDIDAGGTTFELQKLFSQALDVDKNIPKNVRNNRYIVLLDKTDGQGKRIAIDMFTQRMVALPNDVAMKKTGEILEWLKNQE